MSGRSTRSKQRAAEVANASPARSTRSGGRSVSPSVPSLGLRSSSPASHRSISPLANSSTTRGRGRGRGKSTVSPQSTQSGRPKKQSPAKQVGVPKRGRGRPPKVKSTTFEHEESDNHESAKNSKASAKLLEEDIPIATAATDVPIATTVTDVSVATSVTDAPIATTVTDTTVLENIDVKATETSSVISADVTDAGDLEAAPVTDNSATAQLEDSVVDTIKGPDQIATESIDIPTTAAAAMAELSHLTADDADDWVNENLTQLESVLTSEEGLEILDQPETVKAINDLRCDNQTMQVIKSFISDLLFFQYHTTCNHQIFYKYKKSALLFYWKTRTTVLATRLKNNTIT